MQIRLRDILQDRNLTIQQFSELSGISQSNLSNYMNGRISPTLDTLNKIADTLNIDLTELFKKRDNVSLYAKIDDKLIEIDNEALIEYLQNKLK